MDGALNFHEGGRSFLLRGSLSLQEGYLAGRPRTKLSV